MSIIIGIPVHNDLQSFRATISSILHSTEAYDKILIIESGSTDGCPEFCDNLEKTYRRIEVIHTPKEGSLKAYNKLFKIAEERNSDLLLAQTDVIFYKLYNADWLRMMELVSKNPDYSVITTLNGGGVSGPTYIDKFKWVGGWCTYIPLRTIKKVGGFDENFPNGFGVDIDISYRWSQVGKIKFINYWVNHHMQNERVHDFSTQTEKMKEESARYFRKKWKLGEFK
ncbi:MAG: glycosyltransferase family 2 protein [Promethearchaeota archaeon]